MKTSFKDLVVDDIFLMRYWFDKSDFQIVCQVNETGVVVDGEPGIKISDLMVFNNEDLDFEYNIPISGFDRKGNVNNFIFIEFLFHHSSVLSRLEIE